MVTQSLSRIMMNNSLMVVMGAMELLFFLHQL